jgi:hypothetical protein
MATLTPEELEKKALEPESYENDGEKIKNRSADDVIKLAKFAGKAKLTTGKAFRALGVARISTPGDFE